MAFISQAGASHCASTESVRFKTGANVGSSVVNMGVSKLKEKRVRFVCNPAKMPFLHLESAGIGPKRGHHVIVAASPPTEDAVIAAEPLTKEDLVGYLASGCKPKEKWRYGFTYFVEQGLVATMLSCYL